MATGHGAERGLAPRPRSFYTEPEWIAPGGVPLAVRIDGEGPPLLFLHGASFSRMWLPFHRRLAEGAHVIAPEHPGYGESPRSSRAGSLDDLALLYGGLLDDLGHKGVHLAGWSLGGWLAALMATSNPDRARSLTLITPVGLDAPGPPLPALEGSENDEALWDAMFADPTHRAEVLPDYTSAAEVAQLELEGETRRSLSAEATAGERLERRLRRVRCPTLVVGAECDLIVADGVAERYAEVLPAARLTRVPGTGHALVVERPEEVARLVLDNVEQGERAEPAYLPVAARNEASSSGRRKR